ncbi:hypothetical protein B9Z19DRAFT_1071208 [Tuber borchii]|uniref:Uncharacterized protein n=1 Tax=Tuber borchii TaxID=42251 RepID=A0A2T7A8C4_TUBBO|nr:hypothetical protein B9Z19DRAFT_1071208 [Tuber borchii]
MKVTPNQEICFLLLLPPVLTLTRVLLESHLGFLAQVFKFSTVQRLPNLLVSNPRAKWVCVLKNLRNLGLRGGKDRNPTSHTSKGMVSQSWQLKIFL